LIEKGCPLVCIVQRIQRRVQLGVCRGKKRKWKGFAEELQALERQPASIGGGFCGTALRAVQSYLAIADCNIGREESRLASEAAK
jgi:hypothetical protein